MPTKKIRLVIQPKIKNLKIFPSVPDLKNPFGLKVLKKTQIKFINKENKQSESKETPQFCRKNLLISGSKLKLQSKAECLTFRDQIINC